MRHLPHPDTLRSSRTNVFPSFATRSRAGRRPGGGAAGTHGDAGDDSDRPRMVDAREGGRGRRGEHRRAGTEPEPAQHARTHPRRRSGPHARGCCGRPDHLRTVARQPQSRRGLRAAPDRTRGARRSDGQTAERQGAPGRAGGAGGGWRPGGGGKPRTGGEFERVRRGAGAGGDRERARGEPAHRPAQVDARQQGADHRSAGRQRKSAGLYPRSGRSSRIRTI